MSNYIKNTDFASKDALLTGDPLKIVSGTEIDDEFNDIQTAVNSKADTNSPTLTGTPIAPTASAGTNTTQIATTAFVTGADSTLESTITAAYQADDAALEAQIEGRVITAGDGLTGGGDLSANRTLTLGTPSTVDSSSTNSTTATSHTHELDISGVFTGSQSLAGSGYQTFPGGFTIQWGISSTLSNHASESITFPTAFSTACVAVVCTLNSNTFINNGTVQANAGDRTTTGFTLTNDGDVANNSSFQWVAFGY